MEIKMKSKEELIDMLQYSEMCSDELRQALNDIQHRMKITLDEVEGEDGKKEPVKLNDEDYSSFMKEAVVKRDCELAEFCQFLIWDKNMCYQKLTELGYELDAEKGWLSKDEVEEESSQVTDELGTGEDNPNLIYPDDPHN